MKPQAAFTLIELLVVITIIVILLALLAPALDKAIYQAELATCGARLSTMVRGVTIYATGHNRRYPIHPRIEDDVSDAQPLDVAAGNRTIFGTLDHDMRPVVRDLFAINALVDPLCEDVDLDTDPTGGVLDIIMASYNMWWGWQYVDQRKMARLGDRFSAEGRKFNESEARTARFDLLVSDRHLLQESSGGVQNSHPDKDCVLASMRLQNTTGHPFFPGASITFSLWHRGDAGGELSTFHGPTDFNYGHADGSVSRLLDVMPEDERTFPTPERRVSQNDTFQLYVPEAR